MKKNKLILATLLIIAMCFSACGKPVTTPQGDEHHDVQPNEAVKIVNDENVEKKYDVIVVDGSPEGVTAAVSAARNGLKTLLICQDDALGGLYTLGELNFIDVPETRDGKLLVQGIYKEFSDAVGGSGFDINLAKNTFYNMVKGEKNITLRVNSKFKSAIVADKTITGVQVEENSKVVEYHAPYIIDATPDGDVCVAAGAPYTIFGEDIGEKDRAMGVTLVFRLSDVNWDKVKEYLTTSKDGTNGGKGGVENGLAWGYGAEGYAYQPQDPNLRMRGFNIARQENGDVRINSLIIFDVDALDPESRKQGIERGKKELKYIVPYLNQMCPGFENAKLAGTAPQLYVRETRHIDCEYMLTIDDVLENRYQKDTIAVTNYPIDVQATKAERYGVVVGFPDQYTIGYGSLVPRDVEGLLIVGRAAGYRSMAAGSARIVPTGMACAQAAGVAVKVAKDENTTPRKLVNNEKSTKKIQKLLEKQGANLTHHQTTEDVQTHPAYPAVKVLRSLGIASGGYDNNYKLDEPVISKRFINLSNAVIKKSGQALEPRITASERVSNEEMIIALAGKLASLENKPSPVNYADSISYLKGKNILTDELVNKFSDTKPTVDTGNLMTLLARYYEYLTTLPGSKKPVAVDHLS